MRLETFSNNINALIKQRNGYLTLSVGLLVLNIILSIILLTRSEKVILMPPEITQSVWVSEKSVSGTYLSQMGAWFVHLFLDKNVTNQKAHHQILLNYVHSKSYSSLTSKLLADEKRYSEESISTTFSIEELKVDVKHKITMASGVLLTRVGERIISRLKQTYQIKMDYVHGRLYLVGFEKLKKRG